MSYCQCSINEPKNNKCLALYVVSRDSGKVTFNDDILYDGKFNYSHLFGVSWGHYYYDLESGVYTIGFENYYYNVQADYRIYLDDSLTVEIRYDSTNNKIRFSTYNRIIHLE